MCDYLGLPVALELEVYYPQAYSWSKEIYNTIHRYQVACGFDPITTDLARFLGYPIFKPGSDSSVRTDDTHTLEADSDTDSFRVISSQTSFPWTDSEKYEKYGIIGYPNEWSDLMDAWEEPLWLFWDEQSDIDKLCCRFKHLSLREPSPLDVYREKVAELARNGVLGLPYIDSAY
ncbi:hypothetical protein V5O48_015801 [Marasmius crinis-equi]|uniref:Uncharacterized protein n=1 Tax=Marasmius crinis-equi TaxID=585013 RepID=A0ABR3ETH7_9AGAR